MPAPSQMNSAPMLQNYFYAGYAAVRKYSSDCFVAISPREWEQDGSEWQFFMSNASYTNVIQDLHRCAVEQWLLCVTVIQDMQGCTGLFMGHSTGRDAHVGGDFALLAARC